MFLSHNIWLLLSYFWETFHNTLKMFHTVWPKVCVDLTITPTYCTLITTELVPHPAIIITSILQGLSTTLWSVAVWNFVYLNTSALVRMSQGRPAGVQSVFSSTEVRALIRPDQSGPSTPTLANHVATLWGRPTYGCNGQVCSHSWPYCVFWVTKSLKRH